MRFYNRVVDKKQLRALIAWAFTHHGTAKTANMADRLKDLGFRYATRAGVSISVEDLQVPPSKQQLLSAAQKEIDVTEARYTRGEITEVERFQKVIDTWSMTSEELKDDVVKNFRESNPLNSVYMMAFSGARGNISQVRQLVGMRGLMANPQGEIIDLPIKTNFREGLTVTEYIISSYGARKGLVDTALRTADSGYLTRRLVDVSQDVIVREFDCGTHRGIPLQSMRSGERVAIPLEDRLIGRVLAEDVVHPETGELVSVDYSDRKNREPQAVMARRNQYVSSELAQAIADAGVKEVMVRSPLTCEAARSVCQHCYGWSLAHAEMVDLGEAVGIIAAQSIGEPGTQLTMRTFHTGGVFTGEVARPAKSTFDGIARYSKELKTRTFRTRHGEDAFVVEQAGELVIDPKDGKGKSTSIALPQGSTLMVEDGGEVKTDQFVAEVPIGSARTRKNTEKATKDVATDLGGEVKFAGVIPEEKKDRQGNTTVIAARGGLIWILSGEVYNMPPGANPVVKNGNTVDIGDVLAVTETPTENGGIVRLKGEDRAPIEDGDAAASALATQPPIPKEVEIITASVRLDSAKIETVSSQGRDQYVIGTQQGQEFILTATPGTKVRNGQVVAELIDNTYKTQTGGILRYGDIEVAKRGKGSKTGYEITKGGTLLWIPEETHEINKDISLLEVEDGQYVEAGTEVVKDIYCQNSGIVEVVQKNDILREISVKPGDLHLLEIGSGSELSVSEKTLVHPGEEIYPGLTAERLCWVESVMTPEGPGVLVRPVEEFQVPDEPPVPNQQPAEGQENAFPISLRPVQRLLAFKDGDRIKSVDGQELIRTQLVLDIGNDARHLEADIELVPDETEADVMRLQLVVLESLTVRRETAALDPLFSSSTTTRLLVEDGDQIEPGAVVARTEICCKTQGTVGGIREGTEATRRILVVSDRDRFSLELDAKPNVKTGQLLVSGSEIAPGVALEDSGQVVDVKNNTVVLRHARPYRVSPGAILHVDDGSLVQRGDNLVLLVFERAKTGDIIQGLPRIEELLEARKPKEACLLNRRPGTAQVIYEEDESVEIRIVEEDGTIAEYKPSPGQNAIVVDGQNVDVAEPLTDGPANPHEILESWFDYLAPSGTYEAALRAFQSVQTFLVNEVQSVYQSQGIDISDKHIEVIVRQMTSKVKIDDGGDTTMLPGELIELRQVEQVNEAMSITGGAPARYTPMLLGITKASLNTDSFISAASFQETTRVLTEAAIEGKSDWLRGLKENVIIGRLIPAGTGFNAYEEMNFSAPEADINLAIEGVENDETLQDVVLDDRTARAYNLGVGGNAGDEDDILSDENDEDNSPILDEEDDPTA